MIRRLLDDCPNIVAIKAEGGFPGIMGVIECHRLFGDEVVICCPIEGELIPLSQVIPMSLSATRDHEYYGPIIPRVFRHLRAGEYDAATELYLADPSGAQGEGRLRRPSSMAARSSTARHGSSRPGYRATTAVRSASPPSGSTTPR